MRRIFEIFNVFVTAGCQHLPTLFIFKRSRSYACSEKRFLSYINRRFGNGNACERTAVIERDFANFRNGIAEREHSQLFASHK